MGTKVQKGVSINCKTSFLLYQYSLLDGLSVPVFYLHMPRLWTETAFLLLRTVSATPRSRGGAGFSSAKPYEAYEAIRSHTLTLERYFHDSKAAIVLGLRGLMVNSWSDGRLSVTVELHH